MRGLRELALRRADLSGGQDLPNLPRDGLVRPCSGNGKTAAATTTMDHSEAALAGKLLVWAAVDGFHAVALG